MVQNKDHDFSRKKNHFAAKQEKCKFNFGVAQKQNIFNFSLIRIATSPVQNIQPISRFALLAYSILLGEIATSYAERSIIKIEAYFYLSVNV